GIESQDLDVTQAFHSPLMEPALAELDRALSTVTLRTPQLRLVANRTGTWAGAEIATREDWLRQAMEPVQFHPGVATRGRGGPAVFLEIGRKPTLTRLARKILGGDAQGVASMSAGGDELQVLLEAVAACYVAGADVDWRGLDPGRAGKKVALPL